MNKVHPVDYTVAVVLNDEENFILADSIPGPQVTPFMVGVFCGNQDIGTLVKREDVNISATIMELDETVRYHATISEAAQYKYEENEVYMDFIVSKNKEDTNE